MNALLNEYNGYMRIPGCEKWRRPQIGSVRVEDWPGEGCVIYRCPMVEVYGDICMLFAWAYFGKSPYLIQTRNLSRPLVLFPKRSGTGSRTWGLHGVQKRDWLLRVPFQWNTCGLNNVGIRVYNDIKKIKTSSSPNSGTSFKLRRNEYLISQIISGTHELHNLDNLQGNYRC